MGCPCQKRNRAVIQEIFQAKTRNHERNLVIFLETTWSNRLKAYDCCYWCIYSEDLRWISTRHTI